MTIHSALHMKILLVCVSGFGVLTMNAMSQQSTSYPIEPIPMQVEIDIPSGRHYVGEDFPLTVRIVNPNPFDVFLRGFVFGPLEPHMEIAFPEGMAIPGRKKGEFLDASLDGTVGATIKVDVVRPIILPAGGFLEHRRLIYIGTRLDMGHWVVMPPGTYRIRIRPTMGAVTPREPRRYPKVSWTSDVVEFRLTMPTGRDRAALEFLRGQVEELAEHQRHPEPGFRSGSFKLGMYRRFLERFSDTVYAPEIRWRTAKLLVSLLDDRAFGEDEVKEMVDLFDECLTFCLKKGGAYAEEFTKWDVDRGGSNILELATMHERWTLVKRLVEAVDRRYPEDQEGILYRRVVVAGMTESLEKAREVAAAMRERFPNGKYVGKLDGVLRYLERQRDALQAGRPTP